MKSITIRFWYPDNYKSKAVLKRLVYWHVRNQKDLDLISQIRFEILERPPE